jgi:ATP-dependent Clp protease ATP-binding subunit ClpC
MEQLPNFPRRSEKLPVQQTIRIVWKKHLMAILGKFLSDTRFRLATAGIAAIVSEAAQRFLIRKGTNLHDGARPLRRAVREYLEYPLAALIAGKGMVQNQIVHVETEAEALSFNFARLAIAS